MSAVGAAVAGGATWVKNNPEKAASIAKNVQNLFNKHSGAVKIEASKSAAYKAKLKAAKKILNNLRVPSAIWPNNDSLVKAVNSGEASYTIMANRMLEQMGQAILTQEQIVEINKKSNNKAPGTIPPAPSDVKSKPNNSHSRSEGQDSKNNNVAKVIGGAIATGVLTALIRKIIS